MIKITGPQLISEMREKLRFDVGRHLYGVLGTYAQLTGFEETVLTQALDTPAIGGWAIVKGFLFVTVLALGLVAVWAKGDLDWVLTYEGKAYRPKERTEAYSVPTLAELVADGEPAADAPPAGEEAA